MKTYTDGDDTPRLAVSSIEPLNSTPSSKLMPSILLDGDLSKGCCSLESGQRKHTYYNKKTCAHGPPSPPKRVRFLKWSTRLKSAYLANLGAFITNHLRGWGWTK